MLHCEKKNKKENSKIDSECGLIYKKRDGSFSFLCTYRKSQNSIATKNFTESEMPLCGYISLERDNYYFVCKICLKIFEDFSIFSIHLNEHICVFKENFQGNGSSNIEYNSEASSSNESQKDYISCSTANEEGSQMKIFKEYNTNNQNTLSNCEICNTSSFNTSKQVCEQGSKTISFESNSNILKYPFMYNNCDVCNLNFKSKADFEIHQRSHVSNCDTCNKQFKMESALVKHKLLHHSNNTSSFQCEICEKTFKKSSDFTRHKRIHTGEKPYVCDFCGKKFGTNSNLIEHRRIHTGEKKYKCDKCGKAFTTSSNLSEHKRTHSDERPYSCEICGKTFILSSHLLAHKKNHLGLYNYKCTICNTVFKQSFSLKRHLKLHSGEKPHACCVCDKAFGNLYNLKEHQRIHTGEKPYKCTVCAKSFTHGSALSHHKKVHSNS